MKALSRRGETSATRALVACVRELTWDDIPEDAREVARHCVLDLLGCAIAGAHEPLVEILSEASAAEERSTRCGLLGRPERASPGTAALVNGAAAHALDFDDTHWTMNGHPTAPVLPALLALAESEGASGRAVATALVAGIELECRLGALLGPGHYEAGFHATGTLGAFGAAAACAHLLGLEEDAWLHALGLAGTQAAGLKSGFGIMAKPLHAGRAAELGVLAASLARRGFTAQTAIVEIDQGFAATHAGQTLDLATLDRYEDHFLVRDTLFKYHAACYLTHAAIDATRALREEHAIAPDEVERVEVAVAPMALGVCNIEAPATGLEGKFSLRAATALALLGVDTADLATYSDACMVDPSVVKLRDRVEVRGQAGLRATQSLVRIAVRGRSFEREMESGVPDADLPRQRGRLAAKFDALASLRLGIERASMLAGMALGVDGLASASVLVDATRA